MAGAAKWFARAAEAGIPDAQYNLALMHERGMGVRRDAAAAADWYEKAADAGVAQARLNLSLLFARGSGVRRDSVRALMWLELAIEGGVNGYERFHESLLGALIPEDVEEARRLARERAGKAKAAE